MPRFAIALVNAVHTFLVQLSKILLVVMVLVIAVNVFLRYVFNTGLVWSEEVALLLAVWFIFLSFGLGVKQRLHITISILPESKLPRVVNDLLDTIGHLVIVAVGVIMVVYGIRLVGFTMRSVMPATGLPSGLLYLVVPIAGVSVVAEALLHLLRVDGRNEAVDSYLSGRSRLKDIFGDRHA